MDPLEFTNNLGVDASGALQSAQRGAGVVGSLLTMRSLIFAVFLITIQLFIYNRMAVFAVQRHPIQLGFWRRFILRSVAILVILLTTPPLVACLRGDTTISSGAALNTANTAMYMSTVAEHLSSTVQLQTAYICGFTGVEVTLVVRDFLDYSNTLQPFQAAFMLVCASAHIFMNLEGIYNKASYRLIYSTINAVLIFSLWVWSMKSGDLIRYPSMSFFMALRIVPVVMILFILLTCWASYWAAALLVGTSRNMAMQVSYKGLDISMSDSFFRCLFKLAYDALCTSSSQGLSIELPALSAPVAAYVDSMRPPSERAKVYNPYGRAQKTVPVQVADDFMLENDLMFPTKVWSQGTRAAWGLLSAAAGLRQSQTVTESELQLSTIDDMDPDWVDQDDSDFSESELDAWEDDVSKLMVDSVTTCGDLLKAHFENGRLTRHSFHQLSNRDQELAKVIAKRRPLHVDVESLSERDLCVVCLESPRQIVLWPCKCFAICEDCRVVLSVKRFDQCVCCRSNIEGYSRIFRP